MALFDNPFDAKRRLARGGCSCGAHASQAAHDAAQDAAPTGDAALERAVEGAVMRALFPHDAERRAFLRSVGAATALAAVSQFLPTKLVAEAFAQGAKPEKTDLKVGFIPITCATPIIMAKPMGFYEKQGLNVEVVKTAGWAVIRDKTLNKEYDAAHMLAPMPIAISLGLGSTPQAYTMPAVENVNGQAITLAMKHKDRRNPKDWKGFKLAVPFDYSMHNYLLRYYLAEAGLDPDTDVQIRAVPPPDMVANLRADNIDGFLAPDPVNQRAVYDGVGFIHILSKEIWDRHRAAPSRPRRPSSRRRPTPTRHCCGRSSRRRLMLRTRTTARRSPPRSPGELPQPAADRGRAGADGTFADGWARCARCPTGSISTLSPGSPSRCGS